MTDGPLIRLENVSKTYEVGEVPVHALQDVSLKIDSGEFIIIMGPSGSGKSTFMNMIGCLDTPTKGKVYLRGTNIQDMSEAKLARIRGQTIGFIFQQFNLIQSMTAEENVALPLTFQSVSAEKKSAAAIKQLELVGLGDRIDHKPAQLSGGQQQRVAIARALANNPDIILADEPTGNLDSETGKKVLGLLQSLQQEGKTVIIVTHDPRLEKLGNRIIHIKDGRITDREVKK